MKKLITILLFIVAGFTKSAAQSMLKVSLADREPINVSVDGRYFNKRGATITVGDLPPGRHHLEIFVTTQDRRGRARNEVVYEGKVRTSRDFITLFVYDANSGKTDIEDQDINTYRANNPPQDNGNYSNNYQNNNYQGNNYNSNNYNNGNNNYGYNNTPVAPSAPRGTLTDDKINNLKEAVAAKLSDIQKMDVLKDALKDERFTTDQVSAMMDWFIFENSKVSFAEWAYPNTVDKGNFRSLEDKFSYKNSQDDLDKFIQGQR